ncbi:sensor histidine kinase [Psychroserpens damuponensis]|uniref:sensor histidine kinase n=1 Tax=Psychroserpens damuponensis TaxID=943936 RepID=UPI000590D6F4|nr:PAS domain-containing protein [Psychroserpens damuponensis]
MTFFNLELHNGFKNLDYKEDLKSKLALEYSSIGVWEYNAQENRVYFSEGSIQIIGINDPDFGKNPQDWNNRVHPDDQTKYFQDFQDHLNGKKAMYDNVHRVRCENGKYKWIRDRGKVIEWLPNGKCKRAIGTHTDITILKNNEKKINNALTIASEQNNRLKNFAHIVTHNLKQHTGNLESLLDFYQEETNDNEKANIFNHLLTLSSSLSKTIKDLNNIVSVQTNKNKRVEKIYISNEVDRILNTLDYVIKESNAIIHNNINKKLYILYNKSYFESIVQNLLTNALKYKHPDRDPVIHIDSTFNHKTIELSVADNGTGIDLEKFGKDIFGLYKTFHPNKDSEGVGLYLIKNQIESFNGQIKVESTLGKGTTFKIIAPNLREN